MGKSQVQANRPKARLLLTTEYGVQVPRRGNAKTKLIISHFSKQYCRDFWGLRDFDTNLTPGVIDLLGPNGAGKSTLKG